MTIDGMDLINAMAQISQGAQIVPIGPGWREACEMLKKKKEEEEEARQQHEEGAGWSLPCQQFCHVAMSTIWIQIVDNMAKLLTYINLDSHCFLSKKQCKR